MFLPSWWYLLQYLLLPPYVALFVSVPRCQCATLPMCHFASVLLCQCATFFLLGPKWILTFVAR